MGLLKMQLTLPRNARIHPLALCIWRAGITPYSWMMQCPPDFLPSAGDPVKEAVDHMLAEMAYAEAMADAIATAEAAFNKQGKSLYVDEHGNPLQTPNVEVDGVRL